MERLSNHPFNDPVLRFALDNIRDGFSDNSLLVWQGHDTKEDREVWILSRKMRAGTAGGADVLPCALLLKSQEAVKRYAPAAPGGGWDYSKIPGSRIIVPK